MKRQTKIIVTVTSILIILGIGLGVKKHMDDKAFKEEMIKIVKENKELIRDDLNTFDKNNRIKSISFEYETIEHNPMGGIMLDGYINHNKKLIFHAGFSRMNGKKIKSVGTDQSKELVKYL